tara:strand:+ start:210 stop:656 length:447 start_codon:yes stop_codon:yes gene_type:complete
MAVGTGAISLNEVRLELSLPANASLLDCINNADAAGYNTTYYTAPATSLAEFRGYTQPAGDTLKITPTSYYDGGNGSTFTITVTSNRTWTVTDNAAWITFAGNSNTGNDTFTVTVAAYTTGATRTGTVTVVAGAIIRVCTITQDSSGA